MHGPDITLFKVQINTIAFREADIKAQELKT